MINLTVKEWDYLKIEPASAGSNVLTRPLADRLLKVARGVKIGGEDGEQILVDASSKLRAQQVVGVLIADGVTLEILPKIEGAEGDQAIRRSLIHMLAVVLELDISVGSATALGWQSESLLEILIRLFCAKLFAVLRRGMPRKYVSYQDDITALRGTLNVVRQFTTLAATPQKLACRFDELSPNIALNQIMKAALRRLLQLSANSENQRRLTELNLAYDEVSSIPVGSLRYDQVIIDRTDIGWSELFSFAKLILQDRFQSTTSGRVGGFALLFEMNTLFEEFVGRSLKRVLRGTDLAVQLQGPRKYALVERHTGAPRFATRPDIVVSRAGKPLLVIDTKWKRLKGAIDDSKRGVGQADVYQMMAYAHIYECDRLMLLYPHHESIEQDGVVTIHRIANKQESLLGIVAVDLLSPKKVGVFLRRLLIDEGADFNLSAEYSARQSAGVG